MDELMVGDWTFDPVEAMQDLDEAGIRSLDHSNFERVIREVLGSRELCDE